MSTTIKINTRGSSEKEEREKSRKIYNQLTKGLHLDFALVYEPKFVKVLNEKLNFKNVDHNIKVPPLFSLMTDSDKNNIHKNMQLVKLAIQCQECDFELRISKQTLDKCFRQKKDLKAHQAQEHYEQTKHKMIVKQKYEKWKPPLKISSSGG